MFDCRKLEKVNLLKGRLKLIDEADIGQLPITGVLMPRRSGYWTRAVFIFYFGTLQQLRAVLMFLSITPMPVFQSVAFVNLVGWCWSENWMFCRNDDDVIVRKD